MRAIWEEFQQTFFPTAQTRKYESVYNPIDGEAQVTAEEDTKYGKYPTFYTPTHPFKEFICFSWMFC